MVKDYGGGVGKRRDEEKQWADNPGMICKQQLLTSRVEMPCGGLMFYEAPGRYVKIGDIIILVRTIEWDNSPSKHRISM